MAEYSFDVVSQFDAQELTNALDQARREVATRFDFKDTQTSYDRRDGTIVIESASEERAKAALQVLREKAARRQLSSKLFKAGDPKSVGKGRGQVEVQLNAGITDDIARDLRKRIQNVSAKLQVRIQGDQLVDVDGLGLEPASNRRPAVADVERGQHLSGVLVRALGEKLRLADRRRSHHHGSCPHR